MFFSSWDNIGRILLTGAMSYMALIIMLRISGNRTLSQMNSFDFIITVAMGSTFSSGLLDKNVALLDSLTALALLILMQWILTKLSVRFKAVDSIVKASPLILFYRGNFLQKDMEKARVTEDEVLAAMREAGLSSLGQVEAVILETNGKLSALPKKIRDFSSRNGESTYQSAEKGNNNAGRMLE